MTLELSTLPAPALVALGAVLAVQLTLTIVSLVVLVRTPRERLVFARKWPWVLVIVLLNIVGAIVFLAAGRRAAPIVDEPATDPGGGDVTRVVRSLYGPDEP